MGRRKIEIQPITHERNRSVTFLKRKNGLFKKAYELGVLCSVDVAVIIFEERPGHHLKLYQYCSTDIHDIVQRHVRYDGEKDTRGPSDFSGNNPNAKLDDIGEGDDDDQDDDEPGIRLPTRGLTKRRGDGKLKEVDDLGMDVDTGLGYHHLPPHRSMEFPPPPLSVQGLSHSPGSGLSAAGGMSSIPVSSDRHSVLRGGYASSGHHSEQQSSKKPRLVGGMTSSPHTRPSSGDAASHPPVGSGGGNRYSYHPSQGPFRPPPPASSQQAQPYNSFFPVSTPPPGQQSFLPGGFDFSSSTSSRSRSASGASGASFSGHRSVPGQYEPGMYPQMLQQQSQHPRSSTGGGDLFASFLDTDEQHRQPQAGGGAATFPELDWPVHAPGTSSDAPPASRTSSTSTSSPANTNSTTWLDFLSGNAASSGNHPPGGRESMSWERGGNADRRELPEIFPGGAVKGPSATSSKRSRTGSREGDDGRPAPSPIGSGSRANGRKDEVKIESNLNEGG